MIGASLHNSGGLRRDNGAVWVAMFEDAWSLHRPTGCKVGSPGGDHLGGVEGYHGAVGMGDERFPRVNDNGKVRGSKMVGDGPAGVMVGELGGGHGGGVGGDHGAVWVDDQTGGGEGQDGGEDLDGMKS